MWFVLFYKVDAKHDLLVWVEILELASNGEYLPVVVERSNDLPCRSEFILRQGLQRRIRITLVHEPSEELVWSDVRELVVGRIRIGAECRGEDNAEDENYENDLSVVSLGLFPGEVLEFPGDTRHFYRFEAAWDSSLHNSVLLNRVTPSGEHVYLTMSAYVQLENCEQLSVITKDLCVVILGRDARSGTRSLKVSSTSWKETTSSVTSDSFTCSNSSAERTATRKPTGCRASSRCSSGAFPVMEGALAFRDVRDASWTHPLATFVERRTWMVGDHEGIPSFSTISGNWRNWPGWKPSVAPAIGSFSGNGWGSTAANSLRSKRCPCLV